MNRITSPYDTYVWYLGKNVHMGLNFFRGGGKFNNAI